MADERLTAYFFEKEQTAYEWMIYCINEYGNSDVMTEKATAAWCIIREIMSDLGINEDDIPRYKTPIA